MIVELGALGLRPLLARQAGNGVEFPVASEQFARDVRGNRFREQVSLAKFASKFAEGLHLFVLFDPFRDDLQLKTANLRPRASVRISLLILESFV